MRTPNSREFGEIRAIVELLRIVTGPTGKSPIVIIFVTCRSHRTRDVSSRGFTLPRSSPVPCGMLIGAAGAGCCR